MKRLSIIVTLMFAVSLIIPTDTFAQIYRFSGGPSGGTFQYYASAISTLAKKNKIKVLASSSGGSIENIRTVNSGKSSFAIAFSGHVFAGLNSKLKYDIRKYENVMAVGYFYSAPAQLVVRKKSGINKAIDLVGKRVGVGNAGSGAAANAEIFFTQIGIWDKINRENLGYRGAADAFKNGQLDAFWVFGGIPNASVLEAALQTNIKLLNIYTDSKKANIFNEYPNFSEMIIPANTYSGQDKDVRTIKDAALWVANKNLPSDVVYNLLKVVYSEAGLKYMVEVHRSAKGMGIESGTKGIVTPLHPGAEKFWKEKGTIK